MENESSNIAIYISVLSALLAFFSGIFSVMLRSRTSKEIELLRSKMKKAEESESLKRRYAAPLLKYSEELYNTLNDIVTYHERNLNFLKSLSKSLNQISSIGDILSAPTTIYLTRIVYHFAKYFAIIEIIKKEVGILQFVDDEETKRLNGKIRRILAVFFSGRLHKNINIRESNILKYQGRILEGAQVIIGESMINRIDNSYEVISYYEFCLKISSDKNYLMCFLPIIEFLDNLEKIEQIKSESDDVDFRWVKILFLSIFLKELVEEIDVSNSVTLMPEIANATERFFEKNHHLKTNLSSFKNAYGE